MNYMRMDINKFTNLLADGLVEIKQILIFLLEERMQVINIILEERTLAISTLQGVPMDASSLIVVADANILNL